MSRRRYDRIFAAGLDALRRAALVGAISETSTVGDLLDCLDDGAYTLDADDPITVGDLLGEPGSGPRLADAIEDLGLPLDSPADHASETTRGLPLASLLEGTLGRGE